MRVLLPMTADLFHVGHVNAIRQCSETGDVVVGLLTDSLVAEYKGQEPIIPYEQRKKMLEIFPLVEKVVPIDKLDYSKIIKEEKIDMVASGDGFEDEEFNSIKKTGCEILMIRYTHGQSTTNIKKKLWNMKK